MRHLYQQGIVNGVELQMMPIEEARKIDAQITGQDGSEVLYSPNTAVVDIQACLRSVNHQVHEANPNY